MPSGVAVNLALHASLCAPDIDECAELLEGMRAVLVGDGRIDLIVEIVSVFPEPVLLPQFFEFLIAEQKLDALPHAQLGARVGKVIMNCARHANGFDPAKYFDLSIQYGLFRDHAELQMEAGVRLLADDADKNKLQEASRHLLLALAYFLHEKCYSLAMECLKKLSLISLQLEVADARVLHLEKPVVARLMREKDFPFALTVAVAYDMDTEANWADAIFAQSIAKKGEAFLTAFQYFRPITSELCQAVVAKFQATAVDDEQKDRMKQFLNNIPNLVERYRIAKSLNFTDQIETMKEAYPVVCEWCERVLMVKS
jgi:spatacsin